MQKILFYISLMIMISAVAQAGICTVETGFGYFKDSDQNIVSKAQLPAGTHPMKDGYSYYEVANKAELDAVVVYVAPLPDKFNDQTCEGDLFAAFQGELSTLQQYYPVISSCLRYGNATAFATLKVYCEGLVAAELITAQVYSDFKGILLNNHVNLDEYGE